MASSKLSKIIILYSVCAVVLGDKDKWSWATTTLDGPGDWHDRFCGSDLEDAAITGPDVVHTGVSIPWAYVCSKFGSKGNLMNHMCPLCPKDNNDPSCMVNNAYMAKKWATNKDGVVNTYESLMAEEDGLYENGYCFELQPLKFKQEEFIATDFEPQGLYKGGTKSLQGDDVLPSGWDPKETVIAKVAVGCGGNCTPDGDIGGKPASCMVSHDCTNFCVYSLGVDPCKVVDTTHNAGDTCNFLKYGNGIDWDWNQISENTLYNASSCMLPFNTDTGKFQQVKGYRNWCSGAHMHFDTTNISKLNEPSGGLSNIMVRWRPVKCPPSSVFFN